MSRRGADEEASPLVSSADPKTAAPLVSDVDAKTVPSTAADVGEWGQIKRSFAIFDFGGWPQSRAGWIVRAVVVGVALVVLWQRIRVVTGPLLTAQAPAPIPTEEIDDYRFRLPERVRREMFSEIAAAELVERARAIRENTWNGHVWSREDDRGYFERIAVRSAAAKYRVSLSQVYLVLDEGLRNHWPGPDGKPLPATTPPLDIRSNSW